VKEIIRQILEAEFFVVIMDETRDMAHIEQVIIVIRFIKKGTAQVQERMLALIPALQQTGEALENILLSALTRVITSSI